MVDPATAESSARALRFLTYALAAIWILIAAYVARLAWRVRRAEEHLARLDAGAGDAGDPPPAAGPAGSSRADA